MKRVLRDLLILGLPLFISSFLIKESHAQCPVVIDSVITTDVSCNGASDGEICIYISGGFPNYTYQIFNGPFIATSGQQPVTSYCFTGLGSGVTNYQIIVVGEDGGGGSCQAAIDFAVINDPPPFTITVTTTPDSCPDANVGTAVVDVVGGTQPYTYSWLPFPGNTDSISGLDGGNYSVQITDANGCSQSEPYTIDSPPDWVGTFTPTNPSCNGGSDGAITSSGITGGTPPYTFSWTGTAQTTEDLTGLSAGSYTLTVTDSIGCTHTFPPVTLTEPSPISITETHNDISCNGETDGSIDVSVSGGTPGYTYLWAPGGATGQDTSGLSPGTYEVFVTDANGCQDSLEIDILEPAVLAVSSASTDATCSGLCDGTATISTTGGTGPFTFDWSPFSNNGPSSVSLCAGNYTVVVTDANGCQDSTSFSISDNQLQVSVATTDVNCNGDCDGSATSTVTGTNPPFSYDWQPTAGSGTSESGLCPGNYTLTVTDNIGCSEDVPFTITEPDPIAISASVTDVTCTGGNDGAVNISVIGGTGGYTYQWYPFGQTTEDISSLATGSYTVEVTDANGCSATLSVTVAEPAPITISENVTDATCGVCDGAVTITPTGGVAPYTYLWNTGSTSATISNLCAGVYNVQVTDANGCSETFFIPVDHTDGPTGANVTIVDASCFGTCDGEATVTGIGGIPPYSYQWVPGGYNTSNVTGLCAGTYNVQIQDSLSCIYTETITIGEPDEIVFGQTVTNSVCGMCTGEVELTPISGTAPFSYSWSPNVSSGASASGLCAGVYNITVTDGNGCTEVVTSLVNDIPSATISMTGIDPLCNDSCNGQAIATPTGGTPPFTYLWDDPAGQTDSIASGLCEGLYTITLTDANGCVAVNQVNLTEPTPIGLSLLIIDNGTCAGNCDGEITVIPSGGTLPFTYLWNDPLAQTTANADSLCAGTYIVEVTDANGCVDTVSGTVNNPVGLTATANQTDVSCNGLCDGSATVIPVGGTAPYTYLWDDPSVQTTVTATNLCAGNYTVTVTDANNCSFTVPVTITEPDPLVITISGVVNLQCDGVCIGEATANVTGGVGPYTYQWDDALSQTTATADSLCASTYTILVTDANGCTASETVTITGPNGLTSSITSSTNVLCFGDCNGSATVTASGGTAPYTYQWNDPGNQTTQTATGLCAGTYSVTVTDDNGCVSVSTVIITQPPLLSASTTANDVSCFGECDATASVFVTGGTPPYVYQWNDPNNQTTVTATGLCAGTYTVTVTGSNGCVASATETIFQPPSAVSIDTVNVVNATCGQCNGELEIVGEGGVPPYTYLWGNGETSPSISGLCPGVYTVDVTDAIGCVQNFDIAVSNDGGPTSATVNSTDASCFGVCDGTASVTPVGGIAPFSYLWVPGGQTTSSVTGLCAGSYNVQIEDSLGCIYTQLVVIGEPTQIDGNANITQATCGQCNGEIYLTPTGGDGGPYSYSWSPNVSGNDTASALCAGIYTVTITDGAGCESIEVLPVSNISGPSITTSVIDATCNGGCDGTATVHINGGTAPFTVLWDDPSGQTDTTATGLCAGLYNVTVTDANGCQSLAQVVVDDPDPISLSLQLVTDATCAGVCDGSATVTASGGTLPYSYSWWPSGASGPSASGLCAGSQSVTVTDANGCVTQTTVLIDELQPNITVDTLVTDATCGLCDGEITVTPNNIGSNYSVLWGSGQTSETVSSLCPGIYTVEVTDSIGCSVDFNIAVSNENPPTTATVDVTDASCFGVCDGEATVHPIGGTAPYSFQWIPGGQTDSTATGLCAGTYQVQIADSAGCIYTQLVVVGEPAEIELNEAISNANCGVCDGEVTLSPSGGDGGPYTFSWSPSVSSTNSASNLCAGIYNVTVTDNSGCSATENIPVGNIDGPVLSTSSSDVTCVNACDGSAQVQVIGGTPPYTILWSDPQAQTDSVATGLCVGAYIVTVTDANGCQNSAQVIVEDATPIYFSIPTTFDASCPGVCDGSATVVASGGALPYTYNWAPSGGTSSTETGLCAGTYTVTVTDANGCEQQQQVVVEEPPVIVINTSTLDASCFALCDGEAYAEASGGSGGFSYQWNDPATTANDTVTGLCAGTYQVLVTDMAGCVDSTDVTINQPDSITVTITVEGVSCNGDCDGSAVALATGGTAPYTYQWNDPASTFNDTVVGLCAGIYSLVVTDSLGCFTTSAGVITEPLPLVLLDSAQNITCGGTCDGIAGVLAQGGTGPYTYQWNDPTGSTNPFVTGLCAGTYQVVVTDANGCMDSTSVTIIEPPVLDASATVQDASCGGVCDGEASVNPTGGTPGYNILWLPNLETTQTISNLCAGQYIAIVSDAAGCIDSAIVTVSEPPILEADITSVTQVLCSGNCSGEAIVTPNGGTAPYTYQWSTSPVQTDSTATGLCVGIWSVTVTDDIGCTATATATIDDNNSLTAYVLVTSPISCFGDCDGAVTAFASGGVGPYTYLWNDPDNQTSETATGLCEGSYTVTVIDSQSPACTTQAFVNLVNPPVLTTTTTATDVTCGTECDGTAVTVPVGGTPPYMYQWDDPSSQNTAEATNLCSSLYNVIVTDANGCSLQQATQVGGPTAIVSTLVNTTPSTCSNVADGSLDIEVSGGDPSYSYSWSPGGSQTQDLTNVITGAYTVTITDISGCSIVETYSVGTLVQIDAEAGENSIVCVDDVVTLDGSGGGTYSWSPGLALSDSTIADPTVAVGDTTTFYLTVTIGTCVDVDSVTVFTYGVPPVDAGEDVQIPTGGSIGLNALGVVTGWTYTWEPSMYVDNPNITNPLASPEETTMFYVTVTDVNGCSATDSVLVEVLPGIVFPDGISPNGDGINDTWIIDNIQLFEDAIVEVYNRWGQQLFQSAPGYPVPWDGRFNGKDLPVGTYYYVIHSDNFEEPFTGPITIIR